MPTYDDIFQKYFPKTSGMDSETQRLKETFGGPRETMGQALRTDISSIADLDPTNPANIGRILHHGIPMGLQAGATLALGPEANPLMKILASALGSAGAYLYQSGAEPMAKGQAPTSTVRGLLTNLGIGGAMEGAAQTTGAIGRIASGKTVALKEGEIAAQEQLARRADIAAEAEGQAAKIQEVAGGKVRTAQDAINREIYKHSEAAFQGVKESEVERMVKEGLGPKAVITRPVTIDTLTVDTKVPQKTAQRAMQGVFDGLSAKYDQAVEPYGSIAIPNPTLRPAVRAIRENLKEHGLVVSPTLSNLLQTAAGGLKVNLSRGARGRFSLSDIDPKALSRMDPADIEKATGGKGLPGMMADKPLTVDQMMGLRSRFIKVIRTAKDGVDRRTAASVVDAIQADIDKVMPEEIKPVMANLADEWHQAKSTFSDAFRSRLFRASSPEQVAEVIYTGAKTGKQMGHRAELLVNQITKESPDQLPPLRSAFASMVAGSPNAVAEVEKMPPALFKSLFPGTGFDSPKNWVKALQGQNVFRQIAGSPELLAKYNSIFQQGMSSLGTKIKQDALAESQAILRAAPSAKDMIAKALRDEPTTGQAFARGAMAGMREPMIGKGMNKYVEHRALYHTAFALAAGGAYYHQGQLFIPLMYLASSKGLGAILANPTIGRMYYNALTSKTAEQAMFWAGRLTAAGLSEAARSSQ